MTALTELNAAARAFKADQLASLSPTALVDIALAALNALPDNWTDTITGERVGDLDAIADAVEAVDAIHPAMRDMEPYGPRCDFVEQVRGDYRVMQMGAGR
jgi:hypothetical protein